MGLKMIDESTHSNDELVELLMNGTIALSQMSQDKAKEIMDLVIERNKMPMNYKYEYINFKLLSEGEKTNVYNCHSNRSDEILGLVKWYGAWRQYCFYPEKETIFNKGCLNDINRFMQSLMDARK